MEGNEWNIGKLEVNETQNTKEMVRFQSYLFSFMRMSFEQKGRGCVSNGDTEGPETAGQARLAQRRIHSKYLDSAVFLIGCSQNRGLRGELLPSSMHRED